jgi:hypothetical protein
MATDTIDRGHPRRVVCDPAVADIGWPRIDRLGGSIDLLGVTRGELKEGLARVCQKRWRQKAIEAAGVVFQEENDAGIGVRLERPGWRLRTNER